jgi:ABC-type nitrate/sulfonate/bicarbonate transport system substrate-binding protein
MAQNETRIKVMSFPGMTNFPLLAAFHKGLFAKHGLMVELLFTANSTQQRDGLARNEHQIIQSASDNAVAMVELGKEDVAIVAGGDNGLNHIIAQPEINTLADVRGKTVVVDAPNTAFALLLYKALKDAGLKKGDFTINPVGGTGLRLDAMKRDKSNAAGVLGLPFMFQATADGLKDMGPAIKSIGTYQADSTIVMRRWARTNSDTLVHYIRGIVEGRRWALDPANKAEATQLLVQWLKLSPEIAARCYAVAADPVEGIAKDAKFDMDGFKNVLKLRAEIEGQWGGNPPAPDKYVDLTYYDKAVAGL